MNTTIKSNEFNNNDSINGTQVPLIELNKSEETMSVKATPDPEVIVKKRKRFFSKKDKERILAEIEQCNGPGQKGAVMRREGLYSSHITRWQQNKRQYGEVGLFGRKKGRKIDPATVERARNIQLERDNKRLQNDLKKCHIIIDVQKKVSEMLGITLDPVPPDEETQ